MTVLDFDCCCGSVGVASEAFFEAACDGLCDTLEELFLLLDVLT